jgi:Heavy metal associated domain 2
MVAQPELQPPQAHLCHFASGRLRVKIPEKRRDEAFFDTVKERLSSWDSVQRVEVNPLTASVLVEFSNLAALFVDNSLKNDLFEVDLDVLSALGEPPRALTDHAAASLHKADEAIRRWTVGAGDLRSAVFVFLVGAGLVQMLRGNIAAPAATLFWYAGDMLRIWDRVPRPVGRAEDGESGNGQASGEG